MITPTQGVGGVSSYIYTMSWIFFVNEMGGGGLIIHLYNVMNIFCQRNGGGVLSYIYTMSQILFCQYN